MRHVEIDSSGHLPLLRMKNGGACSLSFIDEFNAALDGLDAPPALIITGEGTTFSTGFHLEDFFSGDGGLRGRMFGGAIALLARVAALPLATAAAINGHAFGFGALLALACDWRVMRGDRGFFCLPELELKVAIPRAMMELFKIKMPAGVLRDLLLTGRRIGGHEAFRLGIVDEACPLDELLSRAGRRLMPQAGRDRATMLEIKRELYRSFLEAAAESRHG